MYIIYIYIYRHAHISIIGRNAVLQSFFGAYSCGNMQMYSTEPVLAVKVIVLSQRSPANKPVSMPTATAGKARVVKYTVENSSRYTVRFSLLGT